VIRFILAMAIVAMTTNALATAAEPEAFVRDLKFGGEDFSLVESGVMKAHALLTSVKIFEFAKYAAHEVKDQQPARRLLVLRAARSLSEAQLQQVFRGVVRGRTGFSDAQLEAFLGLLPAVKSGSILHFRTDGTGRLEVFKGNTLAGSVAAPQLGDAVWAGFAGEAGGGSPP
jgi:hypothetical protein